MPEGSACLSLSDTYTPWVALAAAVLAPEYVAFEFIDAGKLPPPDKYALDKV